MAVESTKLETNVRNHYYTLREELYYSLIRYRFVAAYKKPIVEAFFYPNIYIHPWQSEEFDVGVYIYTRGSQRVKYTHYYSLGYYNL